MAFGWRPPEPALEEAGPGIQQNAAGWSAIPGRKFTAEFEERLPKRDFDSRGQSRDRKDRCFRPGERLSEVLCSTDERSVGAVARHE